jgi:hypothetical protein
MFETSQAGFAADTPCPLRAVVVGQFEIAWLDRGYTTNGSYEPILLTDLRHCSERESDHLEIWFPNLPTK